MEARQQRGMVIARTSRIRKGNKGWIVPSQSGEGSYVVSMGEHGPNCTCPDCQLRQVKCKHIWAVEYFVKRETDNRGNTRTTTKITYSQNWSAYNKAQTHEGELFMKLLSELCSSVEEKPYSFGRPTLPMSDMVFASALKVYSTFSLRRFVSLMRMAKERDYTDTICSYSSVSNYMRKEEMTAILHKLIQMSSLPLSAVETDFAVDSSGFSTSRFARYFSFKHQKDIKHRYWVKAHLISGVRTNIVTGIEITEETAGDSPQFGPLVKRTAESFSISEVSADKAYSSRENHDIVESFGGVAFIPFKSNASGKSRGSMLWKKMYHYFHLNREEFLEHYHKRSNVETVYHMIKTKFRDSLRSKEKTAQVNEVLLKVLCHNICVLIQEMYELGSSQLCLKSEGVFKM